MKLLLFRKDGHLVVNSLLIDTLVKSISKKFKEQEGDNDSVNQYFEVFLEYLLGQRPVIAIAAGTIGPILFMVFMMFGVSWRNQIAQKL